VVIQWRRFHSVRWPLSVKLRVDVHQQQLGQAKIRHSKMSKPLDSIYIDKPLCILVPTSKLDTLTHKIP